MFLLNILSKHEKKLLRCLGKIEFRVNGKKSLGSASIVKSLKFPLIATAAHCIYDWESKRFYDRVEFSPYSKDFKRSFKPVLAVIPKDWAEHGVVDYDTGFLVFDSESLTIIDSDELGIPVAFNRPLNQEYLVSGFQNVLLPSKKPLISRGIAHPDFFKNSSLQGVRSKGKSGMSGGPWFTEVEGEYIQNSNTSLSMKSVKNTLWGPYWGETIEATYQVASGELLNDSRVLVHKY
ncbi:hypothetical protein ABGT24_08710 [Peribacillus frigoritolerans]|uniref:trypsin-like serine peptidase n=1 Tax=Peribacillus frigoritolerans TaxID=450367 RepID=UPI00345C66B0